MYYSPTNQSAMIKSAGRSFWCRKGTIDFWWITYNWIKAFDKAGWYTIVVTGGSDSGRLAKFQTDYGIPSETVHKEYLALKKNFTHK